MATFSHQDIDLPLGIADKSAMLSWTRNCIRSPMQIAACGLLAAFVAYASAQEAATFSTAVKVVSVLATVHDREGRVVNDLNQDDFTLLEDGVPQKIRYFSRETGLPLTIGLLVDTSRSQTGVLEQERRASYKFLDHILGENGDTAFIAHFDTSVGILQSLTSSRQHLASTLRQLRIPGQYATLIFSAIRQCSESGNQEAAGPRGSRGRGERACCAWPGRPAVPRSKCRKAKSTRSTRKSKRRLRNQYSIGYTPERSTTEARGSGDTYHTIKLITKDRSLTVNARTGYYVR